MEAAALAFDRVRQRERRIWLVVGVLTATGFMLTVAIIIKWFIPGTALSQPRTAMSNLATESVTGPATGGPAITSVKDVGSDTSWYQPIDRPEPANDAASERPGSTDTMSTPLQRSDDRLVTEAPPTTDFGANPRTPINLQEAPDDAQQALLAFRYSSHLYTSIPAKRSLSVDGRRMREGEAIGEWALAEITEDGAIWDNGDIMVNVPVLDLWQ